MYSYHNQGSQGSSLSSTLVLIISLREVSVKCCCCKMYRPPCNGIRIPVFLIFVCRIRNQGKPFFCLQNPNNDWNPENKFYQQKTCTVHGIRNPRRGIQNPTVPCIPSHLGQRHRASLPYKKKTLQRGNRRKKQTNPTNGSLNAQ